MSLQTRLSDLATRLSTEFKTIRVLISGTGTGDTSGLDTTATNLVDAINEVLAATGASPIDSLDDLTDVDLGALANGHILLYNNGTSQFENILGTTVFQAADSDLAAIAALTTTSFGRGLLTLADQAALLTAVGSASETSQGVIELATQTETNTGTDDTRAVTPLKLQTRMAAYAQPLDSDLTAIAALTTTTYGRAFLELADQAALMALVATGTTSAAGKLQLATTAEVQTGTDTAKAATAAGVKAAIDQRIDNTTGLGASTTNAASQAAVKAYVDGILDANNAYQYKGGIDCSANPNYPAASAGHTYKVTVAGKIGGASGPAVEVGDSLTCLVDGSAAGNHATVGANWLILQTNIDGAVTGPASSVSGNIVVFSGTTGKVVGDSGFTVSTGAVSGNSATVVPTQSAVVTYAQPLDSDLTAIAALTTTSFGRGLLALADGTALAGQIAAATETLAGRIEIATQAETNTGTDDTRAVTPLKFQTRLAAYAQPLDTDLTAIAALVSAANKMPYSTGAGTWAMADLSSYGRTLIATADAAAARTSLSVYSQAELGDPETDLVAVFEAGLL